MTPPEPDAFRPRTNPAGGISRQPGPDQDQKQGLDEPRLMTRRDPSERLPTPAHSPAAVAASLPAIEKRPRKVAKQDEGGPKRRWGNTGAGGRAGVRVAQVAAGLLLLLLIAIPATQFWLRHITREALPQTDGSLALPGLSAPVTVTRDAHGVPAIHAGTLDDLLMAQAFVTTQDRLFQMDLLRRHAAGELAAILGPSLLPHDRMQRTLQVRAAADRAAEALPADQRHLLEVYAQGVNAAMAAEESHLPVEFRVLHYSPEPWTPRDSLLVTMAMFEDLTNAFPGKLARESLSRRLPADLVADLYPVGSWRDHPPTSPVKDLTVPGPPIVQVPLDESQAALHPSALPGVPAGVYHALEDLFPGQPTCNGCTPGSNNWVVSGAHTASGKPLLSNDMHLNLTAPGIWYAANLQADTVPGVTRALHVQGVTLPGVPLVVVGQNQHVAWGFTNLGADVQDLYLETLRGAGAAQEFQTAEGTWQPVTHVQERIGVRGRLNETLNVALTRHGSVLTPILTPVLKGEKRPISLRWTPYDSSVVQLPVLPLAMAHDWTTFLAGLAQFGGPAQNVVYADDQGHIGYHAAGRVPLRGLALQGLVPVLPSSPSTAPAPLSTAAKNGDTTEPLTFPEPSTTLPVITPQLSGPLSPVPVVPSAANEWAGYIPFEKLPQVYDPPGGIIATANARITPDDYPYPVALNWAAAYRTERLYHLLAHHNGMTPADMLRIQSDIYSDFDHVLAERLAYAVDHSDLVRSSSPADRARIQQAADLLRRFDGQMTTDSAAAAITYAVHNVLWPMLLAPHAEGAQNASAEKMEKATSLQPLGKGAPHLLADGDQMNQLYQWGEKDQALEQLLMHTPARWLPPNFKSWDDFLAGALEVGLDSARAPADLGKWHYGAIHTVDVENAVFASLPLLQRLYGVPTGTGARPISGDTDTVKQVGHTFGPSERFTADLGNPEQTTLNLVTGQSGNPLSPWYLDQFPAWLRVSTFAFPLTEQAGALHTLTLTPR